MPVFAGPHEALILVKRIDNREIELLLEKRAGFFGVAYRYILSFGRDCTYSVGTLKSS